MSVVLPMVLVFVNSANECWLGALLTGFALVTSVNIVLEVQRHFANIKVPEIFQQLSLFGDVLRWDD